jgi:hypothetical protein
MEKSYTVYEHGLRSSFRKSGKVRGNDAIVTLEVPKERRLVQQMTQIAPSLHR